MNVVENIKTIRLEKGISQKVLADSLGVDISAISNVENGKRELKVSELAIIANCLGVDVIDLFTYPKKYIPYDSKNEDIETIVQFKLRREQRDKVMDMLFKNHEFEFIKENPVNSDLTNL